MPQRSPHVALVAALALAGCVAAPPAGPSVLVLPGKDKNFAQFQQDDASCRQFASAQTGGASPAEAANNSTATSAAVGTVLGAAAGAAIGAAAGNPAAGAAIGAGSGLVVGGASGINAGAYSAASLQQRYDMSYLQCMASNGNQVPQPGQLAGTGYPGYYSPYGYSPYGPYAYAYGYPYPGYYYDPWFWGPGFGANFVFFGGRRFDHDRGHFHHGGFHHHG
ncbi:MAG TPA: glycine zipper family protein [Stellaceae bacterium]|nr:glycine zipper family protein [Stellaceae bacterium]